MIKCPEHLIHWIVRLLRKLHSKVSSDTLSEASAALIRQFSQRPEHF